MYVLRPSSLGSRSSNLTVVTEKSNATVPRLWSLASGFRLPASASMVKQGEIINHWVKHGQECSKTYLVSLDYLFLLSPCRLLIFNANNKK